MDQDNINIASLYEEIYDLLERKAKLDPDTEPYRSKYEAREKLLVMKRIISTRLDKHTRFQEEQGISLPKAQLAGVLLHLGIIGLETEEFSTGQEHLEKVLELIPDSAQSSLCISLIVLCLNNIAVLWAQRDEQAKAEEYLLQAKTFYLKYRNQDEAEPPKAIHELFLQNSSYPGGWEILERLHTLTLYYLAQVTGNLGKSHESAHLCLSTLHRQLSSGEYQVLSWAINAATLAKFYQDRQKYRLARRLLAAAWTMLDSPVMPSAIDSPAAYGLPEESEEKFQESKAEISRRWGIYCVSLLQDSCDSLSAEAQSTSEESQGGEEEAEESVDSAKLSEEECLEQMEFCKLELSSVEDQTSWKKARSFEEAKQIFMSGLRWLNSARNFYTLDDHASTNAQIARDISTLYKLLAMFDPAPDRRSKMHKRRVDLLSQVLEELNSQYYLEVCRQLNYELGETYSAMLDCKYDALESQSAEAQQVAKINILARNSIKHFQNYLDSFISNSEGKPEKYPEGSERAVLVAYFHLGRLWSKLFSSVVEEKLKNVNNSLESYKYLVDYCDKHPECASLMSLELPACREMAQLLPYKIRQIQNRQIQS